MCVTTVPPGREEPIVLVVAKAPVPGRAKTRLATTIGPTQAAALAQAMLLDTLDGCRREVRIVGVLCASSDEVGLLGEGADVVLGPGCDGGYWLIGAREQYPGLFDSIPWSTAGVLEATLARCRELSLDARLLEPWRDIDTMDDVAALGDRLETLPGRRTAAALAGLNPPGPGAHRSWTEEQVPTIEEVSAP